MADRPVGQDGPDLQAAVEVPAHSDLLDAGAAAAVPCAPAVVRGGLEGVADRPDQRQLEFPPSDN